MPRHTRLWGKLESEVMEVILAYASTNTTWVIFSFLCLFCGMPFSTSYLHNSVDSDKITKSIVFSLGKFFEPTGFNPGFGQALQIVEVISWDSSSGFL